METLQVALGRRSYPIYIGGGLLEQAEELLRPLGVGRWAIVCDDTVAALYGAPLARRTGWPLATFPAGEGSKSLEEYDRLCRRLVQLGLTRSDGILALGGGVTGDLAGFAAATLLRGVALVQAPTTLLAQVDSAVGGKTGLDLPEGKNLLGCFYQPRMVLADTVCLATLPWRQLACGMAEVIKYGCIADEELLTRLEQQEPDWPRIIRRCLACKAALVAQDERDEGPRRLLNFGHTFGHAMEALGGGRYTHGECVAAGMMEMLRWQTAHGSDQTAMLARLGTLLERYDLPRRLDLPETAWRQYLLRDKKRSGGEMTIAVLERPGHGVLWSVTPGGAAGGNPMDVKLYPAPLAGTVAAPPSKSRWHRELICQAAAGPVPARFPPTPRRISGPRRRACGSYTAAGRRFPAEPAAVPCASCCR